jgi:hypothetical protein
MSALSPPPRTWRDRLRIGAILFGLWLLVYGCNRGLDAWQDAAQRRRAAPHLEAANPLRRRLGLVPIMPAFKVPRYELNSERDGTEWVMYSPWWRVSPGVRLRNKWVLLDADTGEVLTEEDQFVFSDSDGGRLKEPHQYYLNCEYSFERAKAGQNPWRISSDSDEYVDKDGHIAYMGHAVVTRAQAEGVLRAWRQRGQQDSLALAGRATK